MKKIVVLLALLASSQAFAMRVDGVELAPSARVGGRALALNGAGLRIKYVFAHVYVAALYLPQPLHDGRAVLDAPVPRRLQLTMRRRIDENELFQSLIEGMQHNVPAATLERLAPQIAQIRQDFDSVRVLAEGDVITLDFLPGKGTLITVRGQSFALLPGDDFAAALLAIWFGDEPVQNDLKASLLGSH